MFSNRSAHDRSVTSVLMPLYTRVLKESVRLSDYLQSVELASKPKKELTETDQFANLYLRKILAELESPRTYFKLNGARTLNVKPSRKSTPYTARYIAENLHSLYLRIDIDELHKYRKGSSNSRLYNSLNYYRMALLVAANTMESGTTKRRLFSGSRSANKRLNTLRAHSDLLAAIPNEVVNQFNEKEYVLANMDVRASIADGNYTCGLEHFALQGAQEAKRDGRKVPGVDLSLLSNTRKNHTPDQLQQYLTVLESSGMFDEQWYQEQYGDQNNPLLEYCQKGYLDGKAPNAIFDQQWYCNSYPDIKLQDTIPAFHYAQYGEQEGRMPNAWFDAQWYHNHYELSDDIGLALTHYLRNGQARKLNPNAFFDIEHYSTKYPDVLDADMRTDDHYFRFGWKEQRSPSADFDASDYIDSVLHGALDINPVCHALLEKREAETSVDAESVVAAESDVTAELDIAAESDTPDDNKSAADDYLPSLGEIAGNIRYFANPGPDFEGPSSIDCEQRPTRAKTVAFYLPQFHAFEENDDWWGTGFSEWRNVARGTPRYAGHYQPRIPRDLGYYDLNDESVLFKQSEMALRNGIEAFCFYYYWFNGKRLMDKPLDMFANMDVDQEFCIMYANENWTRTWDGFDNEVLIEQDYRSEDEDAFIEDTANYFRNDRYMQVNGRPLFIIYRPSLLPMAKETLARWRDKWTESVGVEPWMLMVQGFGDLDPREFGLDGAVEFPPHKTCKDMPNMGDRLQVLDPNYEGHTKSYAEVIERSLSEKAPNYPLIKTIVPHWDNDARREGRGFTLHGSTPSLYEKWLQGAISYANENPFEEEPLVFINAWNEWAEGAYLEPDVHYGHAYLNATRRAVHGLTSARDRQKLLLVGHDGHKHGAQLILLGIAKICTRQFGFDVTVLLSESGPLVSNYLEICNTVVLTQLGEQNLESWVRQQGFDVAMTNTSVTGDLIPILTGAGLKVISLVHELPNLIEEYQLGPNLQLINEHSDYVIFPSDIVQSGFNQFIEIPVCKQVIKPQGVYHPITYDIRKRMEIRSKHGIPADAKVVLNVGYADLRKGFDIFLETARQMIVERPNVHFVWAGALSPDMKRWVQSDLDPACKKYIHLVGFTTRMADYYSACDCLFLTSREDPYPSVVLEAMCVGAPVILFKGATGFDPLMSEHGQVIDRNDVPSTKRAIIRSLYNDSKAEKVARTKHITEHCRYDDYCFDLVKMLKPELKKVSVVVPNYNYEEYMPSRLHSVFDQTYPIFETVVLDDCSKDNSLAVIGDVSENANRIVELIKNKTNSGNVFHQWKKGMRATRGEFVWIAEADDLADPKFIAKSLESFNQSTALSFTNSKQINIDGEILAQNYDYYYRMVDKALFRTDFRIEGLDFIKQAMSIRNVMLNVSSVLWRRDTLDSALDSVGEKLFDLRLVGDWFLYLEALSKKGVSVSYIAESLNVHRRHDESVTHSLDPKIHIQEIEIIHKLANDLIGADDETEQAMESYLEELRKQFKLKEHKPKAAA